MNQVQMSMIFTDRVKKYYRSCGLQNNCMKPSLMPIWALEQLATMGIAMLGIEMALYHAEQLANSGIATDLPKVIKAMMN